MSERNKVVLHHIAMNGSKTAWQIQKNTSLSKSPTYLACHELKKSGLLRPKIIGDTYANQPKTEYGLTILGFCWVIKTAPIYDVSFIMKTWAELIPFVTGKWDFFNQKDIATLAWQRLIITVNKYTNGILFLPYLSFINEDIPESAIFTFNFYFMFPDLLPLKSLESDTYIYMGYWDIHDRIKWIKACMKDHELKKYILKLLSKVKESYEESVTESKILIDTLNGIDTSVRVSTLKLNLKQRMRDLGKKHALRNESSTVKEN